MEEKYIIRFRRIKKLFFVALVAVPLLIGALILDFTTTAGSLLQISAILFALPFILYTYCICILHWKDRYRGEFSDLWGILLVIETSGWFKIIYLLRHMLPDLRGTGRYGK
ncbi:MAG TPA: hypothetical protein VIR63_00170 [Pontiella sp.]